MFTKRCGSFRTPGLLRNTARSRDATMFENFRCLYLRIDNNFYKKCPHLTGRKHVGRVNCRLAAAITIRAAIATCYEKTRYKWAAVTAASPGRSQAVPAAWASSPRAPWRLVAWWQPCWQDGSPPFPPRAGDHACSPSCQNQSSSPKFLNKIFMFYCVLSTTFKYKSRVLFLKLGEIQIQLWSLQK